MDPQTAFDALQDPRLHSLSILSLSEPLLDTTVNAPKSPSRRYSNAAQASQTPSSLAADLTHYRDLFSKLRFSYVEQVTKERFLRSITAETPEFVSAAENAEFDEVLQGEKAALKQKKEEVREIVGVLEEQGRSLAKRYENVQLQTQQLESLPQDIAFLEEAIENLKTKQEPSSEDPEMRLDLQQTRQLLDDRQRELRSVDMEIERLQAALPAKQAEVQRLRDELAPIQMRKIKAVEEAQEAKKRREMGAGADELEKTGRWLRGVETSLKAMLEV
ncbi:hypothetical protein DOTSEDRAFT_160209 [Dothistroma septosporum NZE10]|uniref:Kinetochore protein Sos7 coiled-coil domain-containing protein n=1 Tax=Dothistroma septosporum (strain NZE10 / CBS 128990) TaxID=675120 RepID=M2YI43_DOTSN|nr:hypothetical protein DOTSEDRAFT_160209 [Dothistroma septosporum NZE10]